MRKRKLLIDYHHKRDEQVVPFASSVVVAMAKNQYFADGPALVASLDANTLALKTFLDEHPHPTPEQTAQKKQLFEDVFDDLHALAIIGNQRFVDQTYNEAALLSTNLELEAVPRARKVITHLPAPTDLKLADGPADGTLSVSCALPEDALMGLWLHTDNPALPDKQWNWEAEGDTAIVGTYPSGTRVHVKVAGTRPGLQERTYSAVLSRVVQ